MVYWTVGLKRKQRSVYQDLSSAVVLRSVGLMWWIQEEQMSLIQHFWIWSVVKEPVKNKNLVSPLHQPKQRKTVSVQGADPWRSYLFSWGVFPPPSHTDMVQWPVGLKWEQIDCVHIHEAASLFLRSIINSELSYKQPLASVHLRHSIFVCGNGSDRRCGHSLDPSTSNLCRGKQAQSSATGGTWGERLDHFSANTLLQDDNSEFN